MPSPDFKLDPIETLGPRHQVDPIQYAWTMCNQGMPLPAVLARGAFRDPTVDRMGGKLTAAKMAIHSGIMRPRMPRQHGVS
jgi:hypothetical protein